MSAQTFGLYCDYCFCHVVIFVHVKLTAVYLLLKKWVWETDTEHKSKNSDLLSTVDVLNVDVGCHNQ